MESCVKLSKRLLFSAIRNNVLSFRDFEFIVYQTVNLVNRRPIAFKESLRDMDVLPCPITPENLLRGYNTVSINLLPYLHPTDDGDPDFSLTENITDFLRNTHSHLRKVRENLFELCHREFLADLIGQAVNVSDRYKPVHHTKLAVGDVVLIKEPNTKICNYPMAIVKSVVENIHGEVTGATVLKGTTKELVKRHSSTLIPLLTKSETSFKISEDLQNTSDSVSDNFRKPSTRKAAITSRQKTRAIFE